MKKFIRKVIFYLQRLVKSYSIRQFISQFQCLLKGTIKIDKQSNLIEKNFESKLLNSFKLNGFVELPNKLSIQTVDSIKEKVNDFSLYDPFNRDLGTFSFQNIPKNTHVANFKRDDLVKVPEILELANDPGILRIVQDYLGCKPTISNINMWWSTAGKEKAKDAQLFHRDVDDIKFCKVFFYLTDVSMNDGPHTYVSMSANTNKLTKIRRYKDEEIEKTFGKENIIQFDREKGSCFLVDTYGFHKGTLPKENNRLLLQVQYSINPIGIENYTKQAIANGYNPYINRLILK